MLKYSTSQFLKLNYTTPPLSAIKNLVLLCRHSYIHRASWRKFVDSGSEHSIWSVWSSRRTAVAPPRHHDKQHVHSSCLRTFKANQNLQTNPSKQTSPLRNNHISNLHFHTFIIALHYSKTYFSLQHVLYVNNICSAENMETAAWGWPNGFHGHRNANLQRPNIQISSQYIKLFMLQIWRFYHKMNNRLAVLPY